MTSDILKKSGYRLEVTDKKIIIDSGRRPGEFIFACLLTLLIGYAVTQARLNSDPIIRVVQYLIFAAFIAGPFSFLFFQWKRRIEIQSGRVRIIGTIRGIIDNSRILTIDTKTEQSALYKKVTFLLMDLDNGIHKLFVVHVKPKDMEQVHDFAGQIRRTIGLETNK